jgi:predicted phage tail protein
MKKLFYIVFILAALVSCSKKDGTIKGTASAEDGDNVILSGISVMLYTDGAVLHSSTTTNNEGEFTFTGLANGNYYIGAAVAVGEDMFDTGNRPQMVYVNDEIVKEVALTLTKK